MMHNPYERFVITPKLSPYQGKMGAGKSSFKYDDQIPRKRRSIKKIERKNKKANSFSSIALNRGSSVNFDEDIFDDITGIYQEDEYTFEEEIVSIINQWFLEMIEEAKSNGDDVPSYTLIGESKRIVRALYMYFRNDPDIYVDEDSTIRITLDGDAGYRAALVCNNSGGATCHIVVPNNSRMAVYKNSYTELPDEFVLKGFRDVCQSIKT